ncbi:class II aldolase/adducin family protein [Opitutales bacterium]|nr:class II aldolase/adducin family protein [Opitutales bacterium]
MSCLEKHSDKVDTFIGVCHHLAAHQYVTGHGGNLAWKLEDDVILITPTKHNKGDVSRDNVVFINLAGDTIEGTVKPTGETPMYVNFFRERPDVQAVLHCHPPHLNAFAISDSKNYHMRPLFPETITEVGPVPVVPYGEPLTQKLADNFLPYLQKYNGFLMENHGYVFLTPWDIKWAQMCTDLLEMTALHIIHARSLGGNIKEIGYEDLRDMGNIMKTRGLPLPGAPGEWASLEEMYYPDSPPAS